MFVHLALALVTVAQAQPAGPGRRVLGDTQQTVIPAQESRGERASLALTVVDDRGVPVAGARVVATRGGERREAVADGGGRCGVSLPDGKPDEPVRLQVEHAGHFHPRRSVAPGGEVTVVLPRLAALAGRVLDTSGTPIEGARIRLEHPDCERCEAGEVLAGAEGRFVLPGVPVGRDAHLRARAAGHRRGFERVWLESPDADASLEFRLVPVVSRRVLVVDALDGEPLRSATDLGGQPVAKDGTLEIEVEDPEAPGFVWALAQGYCTTGARLEPGQVTGGDPLVLPLLPGAFIEGEVVDGAGRAVERARLSFHVDRSWPGWDRGRERDEQIAEILPAGVIPSQEGRVAWRSTDAAGRFQSPGLLPWTPYRVTVRHERHQTTTMVCMLGDPRTAAIVSIVLEELPALETGSIEGTLRVNGVPLQGAVGWASQGRRGEAVTDPAGRFVFAKVPVGSVELTATVIDARLSAPHGLVEKARLDLESGERRRQTLEVLFATAPIEGRVVDLDETPLDGVAVRAFCERSGWAVAGTTSAEGRFSLGVPAGASAPYTVVIDEPGRPSALSEVAPGTTGLELVHPGR